MQQFTSFDRLVIDYNSGPIPPPFCHRYTIAIDRAEEGDAHIALELEYFDREELTEEEIFDEGFTSDDNYKWEGTFPAVWMNELSTKLAKSNRTKKPSANSDGSEFVIKLKDKNRAELLQPADIPSWQIFAQEIIQAVFELGKKEAPLRIEFADQPKGKSLLHLEILMSFSKRQVSLVADSKKEGEVSWEEGQQLLKHIFSIDYFPENGHEKIAGKKGVFIAPGDGLWYELDQKQHSDYKTQEKINKLISELKKLP